MIFLQATVRGRLARWKNFEKVLLWAAVGTSIHDFSIHDLSRAKLLQCSEWTI